MTNPLDQEDQWTLDGNSLVEINPEVMRRQDSKPKDIHLNLPLKDDDSTFSIHLLGLNLTHCPRSVQLLFCSAAVVVFYLIYGYMQELLFKLPGFQPFGWYLTFVQFTIYTFYSYIERTIHSQNERKIPFVTYIQLAFYTVATMGLSNASVGYLNYPTQVIFKCCKLIPVLIGGILIQGKRYGIIDVLAACCMSFGLIMFSLADNQLSPVFNTKGYVMISLALVADAIIGNVQEKAMKSHSASNTEVVLFSYSLGSLYIFVGTLISGELFDAMKFFSQHPIETYGYAVILATAGYLGVNIVLTLVKNFGALLAVTVTTCRKAITIILSFMFFPKPFTIQYFWSGIIVLFGIYLNIYSKNRENWNRSLLSFLKRVVSTVRAVRRKRTDVETV